MKQIRITNQRKLLMKLLYEVGNCYRQDAVTYYDYVQNTISNGASVIREMEDNVIIANRNIPLVDTNRKTRVLNLSSSGKWMCIHKELFNTEDESKRRIEESIELFDTHDMEIVQRGLISNRIKMMFEAINVPAFTSNKPSLTSLYEQLSGERLYRNNKEKIKYKGIYKEQSYQQLNKEECEEILEDTGVYYSITEIREFLENKKNKSSDVTLSSRARGIYLSKKNVYIIYAQPKGRTKRLSVNISSEAKFINIIEPILLYTDVYRKLEGFNNKIMLADGTITFTDEQFNKPCALVISDTDLMVSKLTHRIKYKNDMSNGNSLVGNLELFERVYVTSYSGVGMDSLSYLCSICLEEWKQEMLDSFIKNPKLTINNTFFDFPAVDKNNNSVVTFLPVYELNILEKIRSVDYSVGIFTYPDMIDMICKSIGRKNIEFFNIDSGERIYLDDSQMTYGESGKSLGLLKIKHELAKNNLQANENDILKLPKFFNLTDEEFFNSIADGRISIDIAIQKLELKPLKRIYYKKPSEQICISCDKEFKRKLKDATKYYGISTSRYVLSIIKDYVEKDSKAYKQEKELDRKARKMK